MAKREHTSEDPSAGIYTYAMHPEERQSHPADCPICGVGLRLESAATAADAPNHELVDFTRRFWVGSALTIPFLILTMPPFIGHPQIRESFGEQVSLWLAVLLSTPVILWSGWPFFVRGWKSFRTRNLRMFSPIGLGGNVAYIFSIVAEIAARILYPFLGILIGPIFATFAMCASSLSVVLNALRLRTAKI